MNYKTSIFENLEDLVGFSPIFFFFFGGGGGGGVGGVAAF